MKTLVLAHGAERIASGMPVEELGVVDAGVIIGAGSAFVAGATGSLHCALMCGPLAALAKGPSVSLKSAWHLGRVTAYASVGAALGWLGESVADRLSVSVTPVLPWVMAAGLIITAFDLARHVPRLPGVGRLSQWLSRASAKQTPARRQFVLGLATPFLPCGLLYGVFLAAAAGGSTLGGASIVGSFALGSLPALVAAQLGAQRFEKYPQAAFILRRSVPLVAAALLIWRAVVALKTGTECH